MSAQVQIPSIEKLDVTGMPVTSTLGGNTGRLQEFTGLASLAEPVDKAESNTEKLLTPCSALQLCALEHMHLHTLKHKPHV